MRHLKQIAALCIFSVSACAELDKEACEQGDWLSIGQRDGSRGRDAAFLERHVQSCAKHGIAVDAVVWEQGRQQGLRVFCTPESQYQAGRDGKPFNQICAEENLPIHREAYEKGEKYFILTQRIERLEAKIHRLNRLNVSDPQHPDDTWASRQFEAFRLRMEIGVLLLERRKYASL